MKKSKQIKIDAKNILDKIEKLDSITDQLWMSNCGSVHSFIKETLSKYI